MSSSTGTILVQELAKSIIDSWTNSPLNHLRGKPKNEMYKDGCWLSYCLHHAVVEAACNGLDVIIRDERETEEQNKTKKVFLCSVVDALPRFKDQNAKTHSWNIFQTSDNAGKIAFFTVDLAFEQFPLEQLVVTEKETKEQKNEANQEAEKTAGVHQQNDQDESKNASSSSSSPLPSSYHQQPPCYAPVPGTTRVKRDGLFKTTTGASDWSGRAVFISGPQFSKNEVETRRDLWPFYLSTIISYATRAKKHPEIPREVETHQDTLGAKDEAVQLGWNFAYMEDRQGVDAVKKYIDTFKFMSQRIKPCRKMCAQKVSSSSTTKKDKNDDDEE